MAIFTTLSVEIWFSTGTLRIFATLVCFYYAYGNIRHTEYGNNSIYTNYAIYYCQFLHAVW